MSSRQRRLFSKGSELLGTSPGNESSDVSEEEASDDLIPSSNPFAMLEDSEDTPPPQQVTLTALTL